MRRIAFAVLCSCVLLSLGILSSPAKAGDYYGGGHYGHRHYGNVWYSSSCCYKKIVRHERSVRYVRIDEEGSYHRHGYYDQPYRSSYYGEPRRYEDYSYAPRRHYYGGYHSGYSSGYASYAESCYRRKVRVADDRGGWVWGVKTNCY